MLGDQRPVVMITRRAAGGGQHGERDILQSPVGDDHQPLTSQLRSRQLEHHAAQLFGRLGRLRIGLTDSLLPLPRTLALDSVAAGRHQLVESSRRLLDALASGKLEAPKAVAGHGPQVTALGAERVFQQQGVGIQQRLYLSQAERLRLGDGRVARAAPAYVSQHLLVFIFERAHLLLQRGRLLLPVRLAEQGYQPRGLDAEPLRQLALTLKQRGVYASADIDAGLRQHLQKAARARTLARFQRRRVVTLVRFEAVHLHQQIDLELVSVLPRSEEGGAELLAQDLRPHGLDD